MQQKRFRRSKGIKMRKGYAYNLVMIALVALLAYSLAPTLFKHIRGTTLHDVSIFPAPQDKFVYPGITYKMVASHSVDPSKWNLYKGNFSGGTYPGCCDNVRLVVHIVYPDGYRDYAVYNGGEFCSPTTVSHAIYYAFKPGHGSGNIKLFTTLLCDKYINGVTHTYNIGYYEPYPTTYYYIPINPCQNVKCPDKCEGYTWYAEGYCKPVDARAVCLYKVVQHNSPKCGWNPCAGVKCPDKCIGYTWYSGGHCVVENGEGVCKYSIVVHNSQKCGYNPCKNVKCPNKCIGLNYYSGGYCVVENNKPVCKYKYVYYNSTKCGAKPVTPSRPAPRMANYTNASRAMPVYPMNYTNVTYRRGPRMYNASRVGMFNRSARRMPVYNYSWNVTRRMPHMEHHEHKGVEGGPWYGPMPSYPSAGGGGYMAPSMPSEEHKMPKQNKTSKYKWSAGGGGAAVQTNRPVCGNGVCEKGESWLNCPQDCKPTRKTVAIGAAVASSIITLLLVLLVMV